MPDIDAWNLGLIGAPAAGDKVVIATGALAGGYSPRGSFLWKNGSDFEARGPAGTSVRLFNTDDSDHGGRIRVTTGAFDIGTTSGVYSLTFSLDGSEKMRLDPNGRFGIGTNAPTFRLQAMDTSANVFGAFRDYDVVAGGAAAVFVEMGARAGSTPTVAARLSAILSDADSGSLTIATRSGGALVDRLIAESGGTLRPGADNSQSLGSASFRWSVVYAGNGTIQTSDADDKEWLATGLSAAELQAAKRIAAEIGTFRWLASVAQKGEAARVHVGVRAQAVWAIMADEGLIDPVVEGAPPDSHYGFLCHDAWPADEDAGIEACARFGIRPDQLALFLIAAQEVRIAALEAAA
jgi:hypothetical protein